MHHDVIELHCRDVAVEDNEIVYRHSHDQGAIRAAADSMPPGDRTGAYRNRRGTGTVEGNRR
jgi:hypothetical protein